MTTNVTPDPPAYPDNRITFRLAMAGTPLPLASLTDGEARQVAALPGEPRRRTWLTARRAMRRALSRAALPADTSAYVFPNRRVSVSYAGTLAVAMALSGDADPVRGVGVDIELREPPPLETARLFLTARERGRLLALPIAARPGALLRQWTVKEALYKANPANAGTHLRAYALDNPAARKGTAFLTGAPQLEFRYLTLELPHGYLSVALTLSRNGAPSHG
ncbi:4'-phosphopantetheinyl transferase family protein [Streptomyces sp. NPDC056704]|uniref:4'-phosphopantetheinyl transferase family protein n=1 Tax=Streptomyces sp. NPDC056704 TaxID=3345917 RepID=UPI00369C7C5F